MGVEPGTMHLGQMLDRNDRRNDRNDRNRFYLKTVLLLEICQPMSGKASAKLLNTNKTYRWNEWNIPTIQNCIAEGANT